MRKDSIALLAAVIVAAGIALVYTGNKTTTAAQASPALAPATADDMESDFGSTPTSTMELPHNHPPINNNAMMAPSAQGIARTSEDSDLSWKAPAGWVSAPNPNAMRLATYTKDGADLVVSRAGGEIASNIDRWAGQFTGGTPPVVARKVVHGLKVTMVQIEGTYGGGMSPNSGEHEGWSMMAAIVETTGEPYFFKMVGPAATVHAAKKPFDSMIDAMTPR